ncbi:epoxide hydrolase family protein [Microlunatus flavus]|uniref:Pimeloyl-ACP methyl ester carboxylesterase n=1 Tax=Microlunatus flavus TaxID=1036181 RepID=A0A1H9IXY6_9ACTN|nr:epoxide hydrolase family protein [Microlunatus flavus]SEQ79463.1 Pimeloyl-ACP methyl ester carboxylesterase [Microlunatus flavus]
MTTTSAAEAPEVRPFRVAVPDAELDDLRQRLRRTRWPDPETVSDWSQGVRLEDARSLVAHWEQAYDWRAFEARLNALPQFLTRIDGLDLHFLHVRSANPGAMPLLLTHGWPSSVADFLAMVGPLTDPVAHGGDVRDSFDVVIPSLPGFGFSGKPTGTGWDVDRVARAWVELMRRLGYQRWCAHGGDWGAAVTTVLGAARPEGLLGIHLSTPYAVPATIPATLTAEERRAVDGLAHYGGPLGGSNHLQGTKPETVGFALADSPAGQAAWIYEKYQSKTDNRGRAEDALDRDAMLDTIALYWFTNSAASSARIYWENRSATMAGPRLTLPVAVTVFPRDVPRMPRSWVEDAYSDLVHWGEADRGGHFAALEQPQILVDEIRTGLRGLRA